MPTPIEWCDETFNPWWGCERVSPACAHCYADTFATRLGMRDLWAVTERDDPSGVVLRHPFRFFGDKHWEEPLKWARTLPEKLGRRPRVFCASMADVFEERDELIEPRARLFDLIRLTPQLDWLLLTKRPEFALEELGRIYDYLQYDILEPSDAYGYLPNVWMGVSIENARFTYRADVLREIPAAVRFISAEPLLGSLYPSTLETAWPKQARSSDSPSTRRSASSSDASAHSEGTTSASSSPWAASTLPGSSALGVAQTGGSRPPSSRAPLDLSGIDWVIIGGESGPGARPFHLKHAIEIIGHATAESYHRSDFTDDRAVAVFVKQLGAKPIETHAGPEPPASTITYPLRLTDRKGGDMAEWPADLRIREFPRSAVPA